MQQGPGGAAELRDVGRTVFGESGWECGAFFGLAAKGEEGGHVVTCATSGGVGFSIKPSLRMCYVRRGCCVSSGALRMGNSRLAICVVDDTVYDLLASREWLPLILLLLRLWSSRRHLAYGSGCGVVSL